MELTETFWIGMAFGGVYGLVLGAVLGVVFTIRKTPGYRLLTINNSGLDEGGEEKGNGHSERKG